MRELGILSESLPPQIQHEGVGEQEEISREEVEDVAPDQIAAGERREERGQRSEGGDHQTYWRGG